MKVLYIGHYREGTGWAQAAIDYILAMDSVGIEVVCRNVRLTQWSEDIPDRIKDLESRNSKGCNVCIQHLLPHHLVGTQLLDKNIAFFVSESASRKINNWFVQLQQMDEVWVPNMEMWSTLVSDGLLVPNGLKVVPHTFSMSKYKQPYPDMFIPRVHSRFKFYYIGDINDRKNISSMVKCFYSEFDRSESAALILKVNRFGQSPDSIMESLQGLFHQVQTRLRMYASTEDYPPIMVVPGRISEQEINALHQYCDCFLCPSHGEGWSIPSFDAMCFGNTPICSNYGGPTEFIDPNNANTGSLVNGHYDVCDCSDASFPDIFTGREDWFTPSEAGVKKAMRKYYEQRHEGADGSAGLEQGEKFSYENIGNRIKGYLEDQHV